MKILNVFGLVLLLGLISTGAFAEPTLQLGIVGGEYDEGTQTVITTDSTFSLVAYGKAGDIALDEFYYVSIAIVPSDEFLPSIGSFDFNGSTYTIDDMVYGNPPPDGLDSSPDNELGSHGIYPTWYVEVAFKFDELLMSSFVNTELTPGFDPAANPGGDEYYMIFNVDAGSLLGGLGLHFDLYSQLVSDCNKKQLLDDPNCVDIGIDQFAPFSHDAEYVPEPAPLALVGLGLLLLLVTPVRRSIGK